MEEYYAHSENTRQVKHRLSDHLHETAKLSEAFANQKELKNLFGLAGLLHDLGKYQPEFQNYLIYGGMRGSVPHASWGAGFARMLKSLELSIAIDGHHKGLPDNSTWKNDTGPFIRDEVIGFGKIIREFLEDIGTPMEDIAVSNSRTTYAEQKKSLREVLIRYLFSALVDADWISTESHFNPDKTEKRVSCALPIETMIQNLEKEIQRKSGKSNNNVEIIRLRNEALQMAIKGAESPCGFFSLSLPTGMGKTLTSIAWALRHAKKNELRRIILVLPYISIIDQSASILKEIFGEEFVLEHHSNLTEDDLRDDADIGDYSSIEERKRLASENWDYPIVITTTVQFFESLFSNRSSKCRKIHNIAESVVIFDEVQLIPKEIILPTLQMLEDIHVIMRVSFLFCTATQPAFEKRQGFNGIGNIYPLINKPEEYFEKTKRVTYSLLNDLNPIDYDRLFDEVNSESCSALVIFNTKKNTLQFFDRFINSERWTQKYHLSTAMCPSHRKQIIMEIRDGLLTGQNILVISTQLIEAGVDFDFPVVYRAMAPLESIIQSAGRCNREGKLGEMGGKVFLFKLQEHGMPDKTYAACASFAEELIKQNISQLYDHAIFSRYYSQIIQLFVDPDKYNICMARESFNFETVNNSYHLIDNSTEGLYIYNYSDDSRNILHSVMRKEFLSKKDYRNMQKYTVPVYRNFIFNNSNLCKKMKQGFNVWYGDYDHKTGISVKAIEVDKLIL